MQCSSQISTFYANLHHFSLNRQTFHHEGSQTAKFNGLLLITSDDDITISPIVISIHQMLSLLIITACQHVHPLTFSLTHTHSLNNPKCSPFRHFIFSNCVIQRDGEVGSSFGNCGDAVCHSSFVLTSLTCKIAFIYSLTLLLFTLSNSNC